MIGLSRKTDYALVALARLARRDRDGGAPLSARRIAQEFGLPAPMLMNVLKTLQRAELVDSTRGARGGYSLARSADAITVADVVGVIEGPVQLAKCCDEQEQVSASDAEPCLPCRLMNDCPITGPIRNLNDRIHALLAGVTLADLIADAAKPASPASPGGARDRLVTLNATQ